MLNKKIPSTYPYCIQEFWLFYKAEKIVPPLVAQLGKRNIRSIKKTKSTQKKLKLSKTSAKK